MDDANPSREDTNVRVAVRCRPFNGKEKGNGEASCVKINGEQVVLTNPIGNLEEHSFAFDIVFDENSRQESVWTQVGSPILEKAFNGFNGTIFAYGQTGSGKTWSMQGTDASDDLRGIIPRMNNNIFSRIDNETSKRPTIQFLITVSYFEIYNEVIFDLLDASDRKKKANHSKGGLEIKEHPVLGVYVKGLQEIVVDSATKLQSIIDAGMRNRTVASTQMNADSSRSHSVFMVNLHQKDSEDETKNVFAKINLVDLAGSERVKSTGATGATLKEGANINKSLSALGNVINALVEAGKGKNTFIPYRNSKLTRVLQESLGGNSITAMLAALSPAACNFEETLSTLKYANRAKAIKVKAVKNEESSQISRLNDEIRALKEKLMNQADGGGGGGAVGGGSSADMSALEEKNRQQLRDLEAAMKNTWEEKSKMSSEYERERQRMQIEKETAARKLEAARQRNWALLEQKGDLDITLGHVKSLLVDRNITGAAISILGHWLEDLREVTALERSLAAQDTIVQVYRSSLKKDSAALREQAVLKSQQDPSADCYTAAVLDSTAVGMLRQLRDKFTATNTEMVKWTQLQEELLQKVLVFITHIKEAGNLLDAIKAATTANNNPATANDGGTSNGSEDPATATADGTGGAVLSSADEKEILRGLRLIRRQTHQKHLRSQQSIAASRKEFLELDTVRKDLVGMLQLYDVTAEHYGQLMQSSCMSEEQKNKFAPDTCRKSIVDSMQVLEMITADIERSIEQSSNALASSGPQLFQASDGMADGVVDKLDMAVEVGPVEGVTIESFDPVHVTALASSRTGASSAAASVTTLHSTPASLVTIDGDSCWGYAPINESDLPGFNDTPVNHATSIASLMFKLPPAQKLSAIALQGGAVRRVVTVTASNSATNAAAGGGSGGKSSAVKLPCGITLDKCDGNIEITAAAMGDVIDWSRLLKSNPPEKFLKRPPVRFLFDTIKWVAESNPGFMGPELTEPQWAEVGTDKASKLDFMNKFIQFVTASVKHAEAVTTASAIVTGVNPDLTNILLQQLAISIYCFQHKIDIEEMAASGDQDDAVAASVDEEQQSADSQKVILEDAWVTRVGIEVSADGQNWVDLGGFSTGLEAKQQVATIQLSDDGSNLESKKSKLDGAAQKAVADALFVKITPRHWNNERDHGPAMRMQLLGHTVTATDTFGQTGDSQHPSSAQLQKTDSVLFNGQQVIAVDPQLLEEVLGVLLGSLTVMIDTVGYLSRIDDAHKEFKQQLVKENMENLAKEKLALEQLLASEKQSLESNNQDLAEQLKNCFNQLRDTKSLLEKEQDMTQQLDNNCKKLADDKNGLQASLIEQERENAELKAEILRLQANFEKDRAAIDSMQQTINEQEASTETMKEQLQQAEEAHAAVEQEREDMASQVQVLTEERDSARAQEEELFEKLTERTIDLERLQESYVNIADRCNDAQDEVMDLRDQLESLQQAFANRAALQMATAPVYSPAPGAAPAAAPATLLTSSVNSSSTPAVAAGAAMPKSDSSSNNSATDEKRSRAQQKVASKADGSGSVDGMLVSKTDLSLDTRADSKIGDASSSSSQAKNGTGSLDSKCASSPAAGAGNSNKHRANSGINSEYNNDYDDYGDDYGDDYEDEFEDD